MSGGGNIPYSLAEDDDDDDLDAVDVAMEAVEVADAERALRFARRDVNIVGK